MLGDHVLAAGFIASMLFALVALVWLFATLNRDSASHALDGAQVTESAPLTVEEKNRVLAELAAQGFGAPEIPEADKVSILAALSAKKAEASAGTGASGTTSSSSHSPAPVTEAQKVRLLDTLGRTQ
jgi:hypothetical protein